MICLPPKSSKSQNSCEGFKFSPSNSESYILPRKTFAHASMLSHRILWDWQPYVKLAPFQDVEITLQDKFSIFQSRLILSVHHKDRIYIILVTVTL